MAVNKFIGIGNLGRDPELRFMTDGKAVCNFSFAITEKYKDKNGEQKEVTEWINVATFGRLAEICGEYVRKGTKVYVEGKLKTEKYTDKNGVEKSATKITAEKVDILSSKGENAPATTKDPVPLAQEFSNDDDIPF
jgi:single-strand DNA-binding protein